MNEKQSEVPSYDAATHSHLQHHQAALAATPQSMQQVGGPTQGYPQQHQQQQHMPYQQHPQQYAQQGVPPMNEGAMYQQQMMAQCARGDHSYDTKFGVVGIIVAVCLFPCGLLALICDKKKICTRCGHQTL